MVKWWDAERWTLGRVVLAVFLAAATAGAVLFNLPGADDGDGAGVRFAVVLAIAIAGCAAVAATRWLMALVRPALTRKESARGRH